MRDNYLGYLIEHCANRESYRVLVEDLIVFTTVSYDLACLWIEKQIEAAS